MFIFCSIEELFFSSFLVLDFCSFSSTLLFIRESLFTTIDLGNLEKGDIPADSGLSATITCTTEEFRSLAV